MTKGQAYKNTTDLLQRYYLTNIQRLSVGVDMALEQKLDTLDKVFHAIQESFGYKVIEEYYLKGNTLEETAEILDVSISTIQRHRDKTVRSIASIIYPISEYD